MKTFAVCVMSTALLAAPVFGAAPNTAVLDGHALEYDASELRGTNPNGPGNFGGDNILTNLWVTWDETNLYIALQGTAGSPNNKLTVLLDLDYDNGTGASSLTNWSDPSVTQAYLQYNDPAWMASTDAIARAFGVDYMIASEGTYHNIVRIMYDGEVIPTTNNTASLFDSGNGSSATGQELDMVTSQDGSGCSLQAMEARIPWSTLYDNSLSNRFGVVGDNLVPTGTILRLFALIHNNAPNDGYSASNTIPFQTSLLASYNAGLIISDDYVDVPVDGDNDGMPDGGVGDLNAPWMTFVAGVSGGAQVYAVFNENVGQTEAELAANWLVDGETPTSVTLFDTNAVLITPASPVPAAGVAVSVSASNIQDGAANSRPIEACLVPSADGLTAPLDVRFVLCTDSGMALAPVSANEFFLNGSAYPLQWGYPPAENAPFSDEVVGMTNYFYKDITFPPGTPVTLYYKFSGKTPGTGTNNYEIIRLNNWDTAERILTLDTNGVTMVITDYLGAVGGPYRDPSGSNSYQAVYEDPTRGDAGVRERKTMLFQVDMSARDGAAFDRLILQGSDPLRGFNANGFQVADYAGNAGVGWDVGGIDLVDDGTLGDKAAGDGIYSRLWSFTDDGFDSEIEPGTPFSLVGGSSSTTTKPYSGVLWDTRRSYRSFSYRFYTVADPTGTPVALSSPETYDLSYYIEGSDTNIELDVWTWENDDLPYKPASNRASVVDAQLVGDGSIQFIFTNLNDAFEHQIQVAYDVADENWKSYGQAASGVPPEWTVTVASASSAERFQAARIVTGPPNPGRRPAFTPNPVPVGGGPVEFFFDQNSTVLAGASDVRWFGMLPGGAFTNFIPMFFEGNGRWTLTIDFPPITNSVDYFEFIFTDVGQTAYYQPGGGNNYKGMQGGYVTWTPEIAYSGSDLTITYDATGTVLEGDPAVYIHRGFDGWDDGGWQDVTGVAMTNSGATNQWSLTITVPSNRTESIDFVFRNAGSTIWDNNNNHDWHIFIDPLD